MINDVNDTYDHAVQLSKLLKQLKCKINLIPFNSFEGNSYQQSSLTVGMNFLQMN